MPKLPVQLLNSLNRLPNFDEAGFIEAHTNAEVYTSIRLNPFKPTALDFEFESAVPWCTQGYYLKERPSFTNDPLFQAGCYYVQEAGSMFLEHALKCSLNFNEKLCILDACAAPGGKSTLINSLLNESSLLVSNELIKSRADVLVNNLAKWGTANTLVCNGETQKFSEITHFFDAIILDAPCSGSGLFRKQPDAILQWSESHVTSCSIRQEKIVRDLLPSLKENGVLFYSTCSYSVEENEQVVSKLIDEFNLELLQIPIQNEWRIVKSEFGYRFYPNLTRSEGFFCAVLRKKNSSSITPPPRKNSHSDLPASEYKILSQFVKASQNNILKINERFHLLNDAALQFLNTYKKSFYLKKAGVTLGEIKGRDFVPDQELAWYYQKSENILAVELNKENALIYLRKENLNIGSENKGLVLFTYKANGLGWAKILPNRINNYFPNELRILK